MFESCRVYHILKGRKDIACGVFFLFAESAAGAPPKPTLRVMKGVKKQHLPTKTCEACSRPFVWRRKWERDWEQVRYCSDACRSGKKGKTK